MRSRSTELLCSDAAANPSWIWFHFHASLLLCFLWSFLAASGLIYHFRKVFQCAQDSDTSGWARLWSLAHFSLELGTVKPSLFYFLPLSCNIQSASWEIPVRHAHGACQYIQHHPKGQMSCLWLLLHVLLLTYVESQHCVLLNSICQQSSGEEISTQQIQPAAVPALLASELIRSSLFVEAVSCFPKTKPSTKLWLGQLLTHFDMLALEKHWVGK